MWFNNIIRFLDELFSYLIKATTMYSIPFVLFYVLYYLFSLDVKRVVLGCIVLIVFMMLNLEVNGGDILWKRRRR